MNECEDTFEYVLADELSAVRSVLDLVLEQIAHLGPLQLLALFMERSGCLER